MSSISAAPKRGFERCEHALNVASTRAQATQHNTNTTQNAPRKAEQTQENRAELGASEEAASDLLAITDYDVPTALCTAASRVYRRSERSAHHEDLSRS